MAISNDVARLLAEHGDGDAALLYLALQTGAAVPLPEARRIAALRTLQELGLVQREAREAPSEQTAAETLKREDFRRLVGETQRTLGRVLSTEELKSLITMRDYLGLPNEVISVLISSCMQRASQLGKPAPSIRAIEKEAYRWADMGVDTLDAAIVHMQAQIARLSRAGRLCRLLQISGRALTAAESRYLEQWIDWGFPDDAIALAYEKTCLNAGGLKWAYLNSILRSWNEQGLHTVKEINAGDRGAKAKKPQKSGLTDTEKKVLDKLMEED